MDEHLRWCEIRVLFAVLVVCAVLLNVSRVWAQTDLVFFLLWWEVGGL